MARRKKDKVPTDIPVASFSDIAFLLIIFFILVTTMSVEKGFTTDFPSGQVTARSAQKTPTVMLTSSEIRFNDRPVTQEQLAQKLAELKLAEREKEEERLVIMESEGSISYQRYYNVMATIAQAGGVVAIVKESKL